MRRSLLLLALALLAAPAAAFAWAQAVPDGSLSVRSGQGTITVTLRGSLIGRFDDGALIVDDPAPNDGSVPQVWGAERTRDVSDTRTIYSGHDVRFRMIDGTFRVKIVRATGIGLSAVGKGFATLAGTGPSDGFYSVNGSDPKSLPDLPAKVYFGLQPPTGP